MKKSRHFIFFSLLVLGLSLAPAQSFGGSFVVTRFDDPTPDGCMVDDCSLREAVIAANADPDASTITLSEGPYELTITSTNENNAADGDLDITEDVAISGVGMTQTIIDASAIQDRVFHMIGSAAATFNGLQMTGGSDQSNGGGIEVGTGSVELDGVGLIGNMANLNGGGLNVGNGGSAIIQNSLVQGNMVGANGAGLYLQAGTMEVTHTQVIGNLAESNGGGLYNQGGTMTLSMVTVDSNQADSDQSGSGSGGGLYASDPVTIDQSLFVNNSAVRGGGIQTNDLLVIINSTLSGNRAIENGRGTGIGGGIHSSVGETELYNVTITLNEAVTGGGFYTQDDVMTNIFNNTIIAQNTSGNDCATGAGDPLTGATSLGYNLSGDDTCDFTATGDQINTDAMLAPLADNGGPTLTHALLVDSAAIDGGDPAGCMDGDGMVLTVDQRGVARPQGPALICDIGAVEMEFADLEVTKTVDNALVTQGDPVNFVVTVTNLGPNEASGVILSDTLPAGLTLVSATPSQGTCTPSGTTLDCDLGTLAANASATIQIQISGDQTGNFTNTATATFFGIDTDPTNNTASVSFDIQSGFVPVVPIGVSGSGCALQGEVSYPMAFSLTLLGFLVGLGLLRLKKRSE